MMNFNSLKERVKAQAEAAKEAARSIRNFDEMAAKDDYIHHEKLRTPDSKPIRSSLPKHNALLQATQFSMMEQDEDYNLEQQTSKSRENIHHREVSLGDEENGIEMKEKRKVKDPNRFMDNLSERLARAEELDLDKGLTDDATESTMGTDSSENQQQRPKWGTLVNSIIVANVFSKLNLKNDSEEAKPMLLGPLSRRKLQEDDKNIGDDSMEHGIVVSSSVLGAEEQKELERIKMGTSKSGMVSSVEKCIQQNPQFVFIIFTLLLGSAVYFYSRHHEEMDDVT
mmetsp:Transcript_3050/g.4628  ORF Transcript_3050/g.4628 Transcript_3050/m.4628 type:complete len:283 (+) Transcript_3050:78-926(+)